MVLVFSQQFFVFRGGVVCRIWRQILQNRQRYTGFLSPLGRSRHNSSEDFHSMANDEFFTVVESGT